mgnify:FL=1|jgi:hypothetical protein
MKIKFTEDFSGELVTGEVDELIPNVEDIHFKKDDEVEVGVVERNFEYKTVALEFDGGGVLYGVPESIFEVLAECCGGCGCDSSESETEVETR